PRASAATASAPGAITTAAAVQPAPRTASRTWPTSERPAIACITLGRAERMRVPSPAASTMARQLRSPVTLFLHAEVGYIRLRPPLSCRTRVNPSSGAKSDISDLGHL